MSVIITIAKVAIWAAEFFGILYGFYLATSDEVKGYKDAKIRILAHSKVFWFFGFLGLAIATPLVFVQRVIWPLVKTFFDKHFR